MKVIAYLRTNKSHFNAHGKISRNDCKGLCILWNFYLWSFGINCKMVLNQTLLSHRNDFEWYRSYTKFILHWFLCRELYFQGAPTGYYVVKWTCFEKGGTPPLSIWLSTAFTSWHTGFEQTYLYHLEISRPFYKYVWRLGIPCRRSICMKAKSTI